MANNLRVYANVVVTVEVIVELPDRPEPTCTHLQEELTTKMVKAALTEDSWKHVSDFRVVHCSRE